MHAIGTTWTILRPEWFGRQAASTNKLLSRVVYIRWTPIGIKTECCMGRATKVLRSPETSFIGGGRPNLSDPKIGNLARVNVLLQWG